MLVFRHNVYRVGKRCFHLFKPPFLKPLEQLHTRTEHGVYQLPLLTNVDDVCDSEESGLVLKQLIETNSHLIACRSGHGVKPLCLLTNVVHDFDIKVSDPCLGKTERDELAPNRM